MKPLNYNSILLHPEVLNVFKYKDNVPLVCKFCSSIFYRSRGNLHRDIKHGTKNVFCSKGCMGLYDSRTNRTIVVCKNCGKEFLKCNNQIKRSRNHFCGRTCSATHYNLNKKVGARVSKLEVFIKEALTCKFPDLEIHYNRKDTINSELDIYIPSFKLAIELNGIFHYEPIYGAEKLSKIQNNDTRKIQACIERGIEFCIIDVSNIKYFKVESSLKILDIIERLIGLKLNKNKAV